MDSSGFRNVGLCMLRFQDLGTIVDDGWASGNSALLFQSGAFADNAVLRVDSWSCAVVRVTTFHGT